MSLLNDIKATLWDRMNSQVFGTYLLTWLTFNYEITLNLLETGTSALTKINRIEAHIEGWLNLTCVIGIPFLLTIAILFLHPLLSIAHTYWSKQTTKWKSKVIEKYESLVSKEELAELRIKAARDKEDTVNSFTSGMSDLEDKNKFLITKHEKKSDQQELIIKDLKRKIEDLGKEIKISKNSYSSLKEQFTPLDEEKNRLIDLLKVTHERIVKFSHEISSTHLYAALKLITNPEQILKENDFKNQLNQLTMPYSSFINNEIESCITELGNVIYPNYQYKEYVTNKIKNEMGRLESVVYAAVEHPTSAVDKAKMKLTRLDLKNNDHSE